MTRWFIDTEFMEEPGWMQLLSIGMINEDGTKRFYAINREADLSRANDWVKQNVVPHLESGLDRHGMTMDEIKEGIIDLIPPRPFDEASAATWDRPEFWGYYCDYDWVLFCWIFGTMIEKPAGYTLFCLDLKQVSVLNDDFQFSKQPLFEHHALSDAEWNRQQYKLLEDNNLL